MALAVSGLADDRENILLGDDQIVDLLELELVSGVPRVEDAIADLRRRGHDVSVQPPWSLGRVSAVAREGDQLLAAANPRLMQGYAVAR